MPNLKALSNQFDQRYMTRDTPSTSLQSPSDNNSMSTSDSQLSTVIEKSLQGKVRIPQALCLEDPNGTMQP